MARTSSQSRESHDVRVGMLTVGAHVLQLLLGVQAPATEPRHLRLVAALDRQTDGYCVDIPGGGQYLRIDLPLFAHNCKPVLTTDSAVKSTSEGRVEFPAPILYGRGGGERACIARGFSAATRCARPICFIRCGWTDYRRYDAVAE